MSKTGCSVDSIFTSEGKLKKHTKFSAAFLRPAYQYTSQEIINWQRESWDEYPDEFPKQGEINC